MFVDVLPDLRRLQQFVAAAEVCNFTAAAASLHLSQQALSSSVRQLESELGVDLFHREGRRIALTTAGEVLLAEARPLLAAARTIRDHVRAAADEHRAFIVGHSPALSRTTMRLPLVAMSPPSTNCLSCLLTASRVTPRS